MIDFIDSTVSMTATSIEMIGFVASIVSTTATLIEMIGFVASTISTKSSLSATSAHHGGWVGVGVLGGTGATRTDPTTSAAETGMVTMVMGRPAMITDMATRPRVTTAAITAARTTEMTMKLRCAMFSPNTQILGTAMTWPPSV